VCVWVFEKIEVIFSVNERGINSIQQYRSESNESKEIKMSMSIISSRPLEAALMAACLSYTGEVVNWLSEKEYLRVPAEEVLAEIRKLPAPSIVSARSAAMKKVRFSKKSESKEVSNVRAKPEMQLPFCGVVEESWCMGIRYNHGLHTQCTNGPLSGGKYCATCAKSAKNSASGKPTYGDINDRMEGDFLAFRDPKGKQTQCYANVAAKMGLDIEKAKAEAEKFGWTIPEDQLTVKVVKRGRPAKKAPKVVKAKGKRGRPAKVVKTTETSMDEQIAQLVAEAAEDVVGEVVVPKKKVVRKTAEEKAAEKLAKKQAKEAEKVAKKQAKEAEKAAKKQAKEAEKAAKKAAKEAEKAAKKQAKEAEKAAKKAAKEAKKQATKKHTKTELKKKELQKEANEIGCAISDEDLASLKIGEIRTIIKDRKDFFKTQAKFDAMAAAAESKKSEEPLKCTVKAITTYQGSSETTVVPVAETTPVIEAPKTIEEKVDDAIAELDEELVVDSSDDEEDDDSLSIDAETTPTVELDGVEYYRVTYGGQKNVLVSEEGVVVGILNEETNEIMDVEFDEE
jgi:chemotaxis protein histidine kinase CheA